MNAQDSNERIALREYIERIMEEREKALVLTAKNLEHRLEGLNALREEVMRDRNLFVNRAVYEEAHKHIVVQIQTLKESFARLAGIGIMLSIIMGTLGAFIVHLIKK